MIYLVVIVVVKSSRKRYAALSGVGAAALVYAH